MIEYISSTSKKIAFNCLTSETIETYKYVLLLEIRIKINYFDAIRVKVFKESFITKKFAARNTLIKTVVTEWAELIFQLLFGKYSSQNHITWINTKVGPVKNSLIVNLTRGGSRTASTSKMEHFVIIVNDWKLLTNMSKRSILDVAAVLDPPLIIGIHTTKNLIYVTLETIPSSMIGHKIGMNSYSTKL